MERPEFERPQPEPDPDEPTRPDDYPKPGK
jgi:hypothetical protein